MVNPTLELHQRREYHFLVVRRRIEVVKVDPPDPNELNSEFTLHEGFALMWPRILDMLASIQDLTQTRTAQQRE